MPSDQETQAWSPMRELDLGYSLQPASDSLSPGDQGKCPQGPGPDWEQGGLLGYGLTSDDRPRGQMPVPFGGGGSLLWPLLSLRTSPTPLFPINLALGLPVPYCMSSLGHILPEECPTPSYRTPQVLASWEVGTSPSHPTCSKKGVSRSLGVRLGCCTVFA